MAKTDIEVVARGVPTSAALDVIVEIARGNIPAEKPAEDSADVRKQIFESLLAAEDDDALENIGTSIPWQKLEGIPVEIIGWDWQPSTQKGNDGPPIFLVVDVVRMDTGDHAVLTNGSWSVMAQIFNMTKRGSIPGAIRILDIGEETKSGGRPQRLISTERAKMDRTNDKIRENIAGS